MPAANRDLRADSRAHHFRIFPDRDLFHLLAAYLVYLVMNSTEFARRIFRRMTPAADRHHRSVPGADVALPVKILLRLVFRIKYIWVTPWFSI